MRVIRCTFSYVFPFAGNSFERARASEKAGAIALSPCGALVHGGMLAAGHWGLLEAFPLLPPSLEALCLLACYLVLSGLRPLRAMAEGLAKFSAFDYLRASLPMAVIAIVLLFEREILSVVLSVRDDISLSASGVLVFWPVVSRWASALSGLAAPVGEGDEPLPAALFVLVSSTLAFLFFLVMPPIFFLAVAVALAGGLVSGWLLSMTEQILPRRLLTDAAGGVAELVYLLMTAVLVVRY